MSRMVTVGDIRQAMQNLTDTDLVLIKDDNGHDRECLSVTGAHDGRYGAIVLLSIGGHASLSWNPIEPDTKQDSRVAERKSGLLKAMMESEGTTE